MSRILIACWGSFGDVYPYIGLGRVLKARGHRVCLALPEFYRSVVEAEALECHSTPPQIDPQERDLIRRVMDPVKGPEVIVREWLMPGVRDSYAALDAAVDDVDVLVSHPVTFAAPIVAEKRRLPWISTLLAPASFMSATDFPSVAAAPRLAYLQRFVPGFGRAFRWVVRRATNAWFEPVRALRAELDLPAGANPILDGQFSPTMTLALFSRVLARPQRDWPPHTHVTGFVFYNGQEALSPELQAFLDAGPPPIVFTLGSSAVGAAGSFYEESAEAVVRLGLRAVMLRGPFPENEPTRTRSSDILVIEGAPHQLLFPRAAAIVHQGGAGTTGQALRSGKPTLIVPHSHDQPDNASRVARLGVSRTLFPSEYKADRVARTLSRLLAAEGHQHNAERVAEIVRHEGGADAAAALIEGMIEG